MPYRVPTLAQWLKDTDVFGSRRTAELKVLDDKIAGYHRTGGLNQPGLLRALKDWQTKQGKNWATSDRNVKGAFSALEAFLDPRSFSAAEAGGFRMIRESQAANLERMCSGASFKRRAEAMATAAEAGADNVNDITDSVMGDIAQLRGYDEYKETRSKVAKPLSMVPSPLADPTDLVMQLLRKLTGIENAADLVAAVGGSAMVSLWTSLAPVFSVLSSGAAGAKALGNAISDKAAAIRTTSAIPNVIPGAPAAALHAVSNLLDRRAIDEVAKGTTLLLEASINGALSATGVAAVAGVAVSLASNVAQLAIVIRRRGVEYREIQAGTALLRQPKDLTIGVFNECPLLGCYVLAGSTTSDIVLSCFSTGFMPKGDWKDEVERNKLKIDPCIGSAKQFINDSLFYLESPGIPRAEGQVSRAEAVDQRPSFEQFWIARYGASKSYHTIQKMGERAQKARKVVELAQNPLRAMLKKSAERFLDETIKPNEHPAAAVTVDASRIIGVRSPPPLLRSGARRRL